MSSENADVESGKDNQGKKACAENVEIFSNETDPLLGNGAKTGDSGIAKSSGGLFDWLEKLTGVFGWKMLTMLFFVQHLGKGFCNSTIMSMLPFLFKTYHVPAAQVQVLSGVIRIPWAMKPILGLLSDTFPIGGYNKAPYMFVTVVLGAGGLLYAGIAPQVVTSVAIVTMCIFMATLQQSTCDLLSEAKYAEKIQAHPEYGPHILTYVWFGLNLCGLVATAMSGPLLHVYGPKLLCVIAAIPILCIIFPVSAGYMDETRVTPEKLASLRRKYFEQRELLILVLVMFVATIVLTISGIMSHSAITHCCVAIGIGLAVLFAFSLVLSPVIAKFNAFSLIQTSLTLSVSGATFYFYTDTPEQYPEGPHFSETFYSSVLQSLGSVMSLVGIYLYQRYLSHMRYRDMWVLTMLLACFFSMLDAMMFARLNKKIGIPDHLLVMGLSVFEVIIQQWQWMPQVVILSYLCPKGMEATMFALLAGCHNLGIVISANCGALLLEVLGVQPNGTPNESEQFKNLWMAAACAAVLPLVAVLLLVDLIPDAKQTDRLLVESENGATTGSLWRRLTGKTDA